LDVIPLDASLVKGSHGRDHVTEAERPVLLGSDHPVNSAEDVHDAILAAFVPCSGASVTAANWP